VIVLRTFSKIYGLAGLRVGYGIGPSDVVTEIGKVRRAFDITSAAQVAALASLGDEGELARRREQCAAGRLRVAEILDRSGFTVVGPPVANFVFADTGADARAVFDALLRRGVIVRPLAGFGAPTAIRVTVGTSEENTFLAEALERAVPVAATQ
jgi:histidinol-phosphate aminotransferase